MSIYTAIMSEIAGFAVGAAVKLTQDAAIAKSMNIETPESLGVYVCNRFIFAAVVAKSQKHAAALLNVQLASMSLPMDAHENDMGLVMQKDVQAIILSGLLSKPVKEKTE